MMKMYSFVYEPTFERSAKGVLSEDDLMQLEDALLRDPHAGDVIPDTNGARKLRVALPGRGKSGGARVIYIFVEVGEIFHLLLCYPKNVRGNLMSDQKNTLRTIIATIKEGYRQ